MSSNHLSIPQSPTPTATTSTPASTPFNPRTHRHKRSQAILGDFDGLGLFNIPPPPPLSSPGGGGGGGGSSVAAQSIPNTSTRSSYYGHRSALSNSNVFGTTGSPARHNNSNNTSRTISASAPKERVVGFAETPRTKTDEDYALDRYFHFNNKDDFANPIDNGFAFPKSEFDHEHGEEEEEDDDLHNFSTSPTSQGVTYTTNFRKSLSSPIQLSNKLSHSSLRQQSTPHLLQSPRHLTYQLLQLQLQHQQLQLQELDVPDAMIDLDYILTANLHIGLQLHDDTIFSADEFLGSPAIAEEEDTMEDKTILASTTATLKNHDEIEEQDLQELQLNEEDSEALPQPTNNFYSLTNSSSSSFNSVPPPSSALPTSSSSSSAPAQPPTPSFSTPTRQRSGAKAHRYQIFYDQSNRISNAMRGSAESIDRTSTNTPPLSVTGLPQSPSISTTSTTTASQPIHATNTGQTPVQLQQQPSMRKTRYLNHYSSLPTLKSKRSFSSIRYNELKKVSSPTKEYYRLQSTLSPSKYNGNGFNNTVHSGGSNNNSNINGSNNTVVPIDLPTTLHPPVPQCSTPSTLATQSTTESVSTAISNKRGDASTSPISVNSEISSMVISDGKSVPQQAEVVESDDKPAIVVSTRDLEPSLPMQDSASTISSHLCPIPQLGHSNDNLILLQSESTILNTLSPRIVTTTTITNGSNKSSSSIQESSGLNPVNNNHPQFVLAPPPPSSDISTVRSLPVSSTSSPTSLTFKPSRSSSPTKKLNMLGKPSTATRRPLSPAESNFLKQTQIPKPKKKLDAPMSKYDYHNYPKREGKLNKLTKHGDGDDVISSSSNASSSAFMVNESEGVPLSISLINETKIKRGQANGTSAARRRGHTRSKSNVEDSLSLAGMKRSSRFFDWLRKK